MVNLKTQSTEVGTVASFLLSHPFLHNPSTDNFFTTLIKWTVL